LVAGHAKDRTGRGSGLIPAVAFFSKA
jgi:hypothetical protein